MGIWEEKPESKVVGFELSEYDDKGDPLCATVHHYDVGEIDAFHEKLKEAWDEDHGWYESAKQTLDEQADQLEAVREFVLSRREDIEHDVEDLGMLKPVLAHFLEAE